MPFIDNDFEKYVSKKMERFSLSKTKTSYLADNAFASMKYLTDIRIQNNRISMLKRSMFTNYSMIETFLFNGNRIQEIPDDMFSQMPYLLRVGLDDNNISILPESVFKHCYDKLISLLLSGNPIQCDCSLQWIVNRKQNRHDKYLTGTCVSPKHNDGTELRDLVKQDFLFCL
ncbi:hypothetical protein CDAR_177811 [Caerostris darwini]|uniref:LRRCT domain-containing protein n=1 Tax=Caerostris darwini TaxID=1538125 RepID=A0AAV4TE28_9ARAC|nr:hypothetical protein CDAR_177811 [Caerostris darwini]